jgi:hypothetical protein
LSLVQNPNATRPRLSIRARPLALEAYRSKLGLVETKPEAQRVDSAAPPPAEKVCDPDVAGSVHMCVNGHDQIGVAVPSVVHQESGAGITRPRAAKKPRPPLPFVRIEGEPTLPPEGMTHTEGSFKEIAKWTWKIARDVSRRAPEGRRKAAYRSVHSHRLSVVDAFRRRVARAVVVDALSNLFQSQCPSSEILGQAVA